MKTLYQNICSRELTDIRDEAIEWFQKGFDVRVLVYSDYLGEWVEETIWRS